jgi:aspartate/glutamate racemase
MCSVSLPSAREELFVHGIDLDLSDFRRALVDAACLLSSIGIRTVAMPCFSLTPLLESVAKEHSLSVINPLVRLKESVQQYDNKIRVGLLATPHGTKVLTQYLGNACRVIPPHPDVQNTVSDLISMILSGQTRKRIISDFRAACHKYSITTDMLIVGCSEISLIKKPPELEVLDLLDVLVDMTKSKMEETVV